MKKFRSLLLMLLALSMILSLASCELFEKEEEEITTEEVTEEATEPEETLTADEVYDRIDAKMDAYDSYESTFSMILNATVNGIDIKTQTEGVDIRRGLATDNFEFYTDMEMTVSTSASSEKEKIVNIEAYHEGNYFVSYRGGGISQKLYSPMSKEDARAYAEKEESDFFQYNDCVNKECVKNEDGTYEVIFSGYTAKAISDILEDTGLDTSMLSAEIVDVKFSIKADAEFNATDIAFDFEFKPTSGTKLPELSAKGTYSKYNEAEIKPAAINPDQYTKIDDVRLLDEVEELLAARTEAEEGEFTLTISQQVKVMGESQYSQEVDKVVYGVGKEGYFYDIDADMNGTKYDISYSQGAQSVTADGQTQKVPQAEQDARAFIENLINSCQYDEQLVTGLTKVSDNEYTVTCEPKASYEAVFESMGAKYRSVKQTITLTLEDGKIMKIDSNVDSKGYFTEGFNTYEVSFTVKSEVVFGK